MGLFSAADIAKVNKVAEKSKEVLKPVSSVNTKSINDELKSMSDQVLEYFQDSEAILINTVEDLHSYVDKCIEYGYAGIDTETTGLDRIKDTIVGVSLYVPGESECYIPIKHLVPIFDTPYKGQLSYEEVGKELSRIKTQDDCKLIFANADFDLSMIYKDLGVDLNDAFYYDVILAWRCLKENERDNALKVLYNKYVLKGKGHPMKFNDFFSVKLFPYSRPEVAMLYAANDAKITFELFKWQLPYITKDNPKCKKSHLEAISDLIWNVEMPLVKVCQNMHRTGIYVDKETARALITRYTKRDQEERAKLSAMIDDIIAESNYTFDMKRPFKNGQDFNPKSPVHVKYLVYTMLGVTPGKDGQTTDKSFLHDLNIPVTNQILKVRSLGVLISTFVDKMPKATTSDSRIHAQFRQIGADTGRLSSAEPNMQNIPSHATDIRHMFRATPGYVMLSSDYSSQEPRLTAFVSRDPKMIQSFKDGKDIYASIASLAFNVPYEKCLEFHPETGEYQPDGKARRSEAKTIVLGITYGRSVPSIGEQLYGTRDDMTQEEKTKGAQKVYDSVLNAFPNLRQLMISAQASAKKKGYTETILGRRRHLPDMQLEEFEFVPKKGYVNPDIDPLDVTTLQDKSVIPQRIVDSLKQEFKGYKYFGQIAKRIRELDEQNIKVINNRAKINDASRQVVNCVDLDTEIMTVRGWRYYDELQEGDEILAFDLNLHKVVRDKIKSINVYSGKFDVVHFKSPTFEALSTYEHRWVVCESNEAPRIKLTNNIYRNNWPDYPILRCGDNLFEDNADYSDSMLRLVGWILTDGNYSSKYYGVTIYQTTRTTKNLGVYQSMIDTLKECGIEYTDTCTDGYYHSIYLKKNAKMCKIVSDFPDRKLTYTFLNTLSQRQADILMWSMIEGDGTLGINNRNITYTCGTKEQSDLFQYLCFLAGRCSNCYEVTPAEHNSNPSANVIYFSVSNRTPIHVTKPYYTVSVFRTKRAHIYPHHKSIKQVEGVWCPTTFTGTWIMRKNGKVSITGNSIIQGSAADQTKLAILMLENNPEWRKMGGRLLIPVHDELVCEVPMDKWKEGGELLSKMMCDAADFLPFPSKCDVTTTLRWYGLEYPCVYPKPSSLNNLTEDEVKWVQYHLCELEYQLPVLPDENGDKPRGDAAQGVNGVVTDEYNNAIQDYINRYRLSEDTFIDAICKHVEEGVSPNG